jgi:hypothetical protein
LDETVSRYRNRKTVMMWEISNELTLNADIGDDHRVYEGQRMPTLKDVASFYDDVAKRIKASDPLRLVNNGGSGMREHQWHLYQRQGWILDTFAEQLECYKLLFANSAVDVMDIHFYPNNQPGQIIMGDNAKETILGCKGYMTIAAQIGKPLMIGELGLAPAAKTDTKTWAAATNYFESYANAAAALPWVKRTLDNAIEAGVQLVYWWSYQSDREQDQRDPQRFDLERERNPELIQAIVAANQRLKRRQACP